MTRIKHLVTAFTFSLTLVGCTNLNIQTHKNLPDEIYATALQKLKNGHWEQAIIKLEMLNNNYAFNPFLQQVQLDLIYAYYKNADLPMVLATIDRFMRMNPTHPKIDYVLYMRGLTNMALDNNILHELFDVDRSDRDPQHARDAYNDLYKLVHNYPKSKYVKNATKHLVILKDRLAKYEYSIASYYSRRGVWIAVVNRVEGMLRNYPDTQATHNGLKLMQNAYRKMQMNAQADKIAKVITANSSKT